MQFDIVAFVLVKRVQAHVQAMENVTAMEAIKEIYARNAETDILKIQTTLAKVLFHLFIEVASVCCTRMFQTCAITTTFRHLRNRRQKMSVLFV